MQIKGTLEQKHKGHKRKNPRERCTNNRSFGKRKQLLKEKRYFKDVIEKNVPELKKDLSHLINEAL